MSTPAPATADRCGYCGHACTPGGCAPDACAREAVSRTDPRGDSWHLYTRLCELLRDLPRDAR